MSSVRRLDTEKLRTRRIIATASLTVVAITFLLLYRGGVAFVSSVSEASASRSVNEPGMVAATTAQVAATTSDGSPTADQMSASGMPRREPSAAPQPVASNPEDSSPTAIEQRMFKSRRALETIDPREFLRQGRK